MTSLRIEFVPSAARDFKSLDPVIKPRIVKALDHIGRDALSGKPLQGPYRGLRSYRVGDFRIVYRLDPPARLVVIYRIGNRRDIYR